MSCVQYLATCSIPKVATRTGLTGAFAYLNAVGLGIWYASGATFNDPRSRAPQDQSRAYIGQVKPNTFTKGFSCNVQAACTPYNPFA